MLRLLDSQVDAVASVPHPSVDGTSLLAAAFSNLEGNTWDGGVAVMAASDASAASAPSEASDARGPATVSCWIKLDTGVSCVKWVDPTVVVAGCDNGDVKVRRWPCCRDLC